MNRMTLICEEVEASVQSVPFWWHSIDLGGGLVTPGVQPREFLNARLRSLQLPDVHGKTVLDIGAYDGFYSFAVERLGAARVVALDHYVWSLELPEHIKYWNECKERGIVPELYHNTPHWRPRNCQESADTIRPIGRWTVESRRSSLIS